MLRNGYKGKAWVNPVDTINVRAVRVAYKHVFIKASITVALWQAAPESKCKSLNEEALTLTTALRGSEGSRYSGKPRRCFTDRGVRLRSIKVGRGRTRNPRLRKIMCTIHRSAWIKNLQRLASCTSRRGSTALATGSRRSTRHVLF